MQELSEINGTVSAVIFRNDENGYGVVKLELDSGENVTAVGCLPYIAPGEMISAEGSWMTHAQHGRGDLRVSCRRHGARRRPGNGGAYRRPFRR